MADRFHSSIDSVYVRARLRSVGPRLFFKESQSLLNSILEGLEPLFKIL